MAVESKIYYFFSMIFCIISCFFLNSNAKSAENIIDPEVDVGLINLSKLGLVESNFWLPVQSTISQPSRPRLSIDKIGLDFTFCVSIDFKIDKNGNVSQWHVVGTHPLGFDNQISRHNFNNLFDWRFEPSSKNINRQEVISNRIFIFDPKPGNKRNKCLSM